MIRRPPSSPLFPSPTLFRSLDADEVVRRAAKVFGRVGNVQRHHQLPRLVGTLGCGAMIEVRREREEALRRNQESRRGGGADEDRESTRLNSSHQIISYDLFF